MPCVSAVVQYEKEVFILYGLDDRFYIISRNIVASSLLSNPAAGSAMMIPSTPVSFRDRMYLRINSEHFESSIFAKSGST